MLARHKDRIDVSMGLDALFQSNVRSQIARAPNHVVMGDPQRIPAGDVSRVYVRNTYPGVRSVLGWRPPRPPCTAEPSDILNVAAQT